MTRYYSRNCYANAEKRIEGWHYDLRLALWCHSIRRPKVHPLDSICAKDTGRPKRRLNKHERDEITDIISESPLQLTKQENPKCDRPYQKYRRGSWRWGRVKSGKLTGKVAIVTGAASASAEPRPFLFAEEGAYTIIADIDSKGGEEAVTQPEPPAATPSSKASTPRTPPGRSPRCRHPVHLRRPRYPRQRSGLPDRDRPRRRCHGGGVGLGAGPLPESPFPRV